MPDPSAWTRRDLMKAAVAVGLVPVSGTARGGVLGGWGPAPEGAVVLSNATLVTHEGQVLKGAGVRVEGGVITDLGPGVTGGVDLAGDWLVPGFTDAGCQLGTFEIGLEKATRDDGDTDAITPDARAWDGYNPLGAPVAVTRAGGITAALVHLRGDRLVPGQAALMRTAGRTVAEATIRAPMGLSVSFGHGGGGGSGAPTSRVGAGRKLRALFDDVDPPPPLGEKKARGRRGGGAPPEPKKGGAKVLEDVRARKLKVLAAADRADDLLRAVAWAEAFSLDLVLVGGAEAHVVAQELADAGTPILLGPLMVQPSSFNHPHARYDNAAILHEHGVQFAFRSGGNHFARGLRVDAGVAVAHGLPWSAAIAALTSEAGAILGVPNHGRMAQGAPATFFRATGDPLQPRSRITDVWIDGRPTDMENRQTRLYERFKVLGE